MAVVDARGFQLVGDPVSALAGGFRVGAGIQDRMRQQQQLQKQEQIKQLLAGQPAPAAQTEQDAMLAEQSAALAGISPQAEAEQPQPLLSQADLEAQARQIDPVMAEQTLKAMGIDSASKRAEASRFAARVQSLPPEMQNQEIMTRAEELRAEGRDPQDTLQLLDMNPVERATALQGVQLLDLSTKERLGLQQRQQAAAAKSGRLAGVQSSKILDDGTVVSVMKDGGRRVTSPEGNILTGDAAAQAIRDSNEFGVDIQQQRAKGREKGKGAGKLALDAFERVGQIKENVLDLQRGIDLIKKEGATTGFIQDFLPNMRASTRKLANLRRKLGLNVVGAVTFGALSKGELDLAMDVALPTGISPEETVKWIQARMDAQNKLAANLEDASLFLADNSVADLIRRNKQMEAAAKKKEKTQQTTEQKSVTEMTDEELQAELNKLEGGQ